MRRVRQNEGLGASVSQSVRETTKGLLGYSIYFFTQLAATQIRLLHTETFINYYLKHLGTIYYNPIHESIHMLLLHYALR